MGRGQGLHARVFVDGRIITSPDTPPPRTPAELRRARRHRRGLTRRVAEGTRRRADELVIVVLPRRHRRFAQGGALGLRRRLSSPQPAALRRNRGLTGTKSEALGFLCGRWGIERERVLAFVDADNDIHAPSPGGIAVGGMTARSARPLTRSCQGGRRRRSPLLERLLEEF